MKQIKLCVGVLLLVAGLMVNPLFAGQTISTAYNVAYETLGTARNVTASNPLIVLGNTLPNGALVNLNLSGAANFIANQTYYLCANNGAAGNSVIGSGATTTSTLALIADKITNLGLNLTAGNSVFLSSANTCSYGGTTANLAIPASSAVGTTALSGNTSYYGNQLDTFSSNTVARIGNQITTTLTTAELIQIDYLTGAANGSTLVAVTGATNLIAMSPSKLVVTNAAANFDYKISSVPNNDGAYNQVLTLSDSQNWTGIRNAFLGASGACTSSIAAAVNAPASGNMTINNPNITSTSSSAIAVTLCVNVAGNVALPSRTISGAYAYVVSSTTTGLLTPAGGSSVAWQTWIPNGYQAFNPYMYVGTAGDSHTDDVFVRLYNNSNGTAHVFVDVYPADGSASQRLVLADIASNTAGLYWAADIGASAGLAYGTSYAAQFTVTAPKDQVNGVSFMKRTAGERQMPLYKSINGASNYQVE